MRKKNYYKQKLISHKVKDFGFSELEIGKVYSDWIYSIINPFISDRVLEIGCGLALLGEKYIDKKLVILSDINGDYLTIAQTKYKRFKNINTYKLDISKIKKDQLRYLKKNKIQTVILINVLEHIADDLGTLKNIYKILEPGGKIIIFVPAIKQIFGTLDEAFGHFRRYSLIELRSKLEKTDFKILYSKYFNFIGILWWFITGKILRKRNLPRTTGFMLKLIVPILSKIEHKTSIPIGQSIIVIAKKN